MITFVSPAVTRLTGFTPEEVCELPFAAQLAPASAEMLRTEMAVQIPLFQARQALPHPHFELEAIRKDGSTLWLESLSNPQYDAGGSLVGFVVVLRDVTERKRLEAALRNSEMRYRLLVDNAEDVIWTVDLEGRFTFVNPSVERQLGYRPEELIGQRFDRWLTPASAAAAMAMFAAAAVQRKGRTTSCNPRSSRASRFAKTARRSLPIRLAFLCLTKPAGPQAFRESRAMSPSASGLKLNGRSWLIAGIWRRRWHPSVSGTGAPAVMQ